MGLGSAAFANWIPANKAVFLYLAIGMMALSLAMAIREKRKKCSNKGLIVFAVVSTLTVALIFISV